MTLWYSLFWVRSVIQPVESLLSPSLVYLSTNDCSGCSQLRLHRRAWRRGRSWCPAALWCKESKTNEQHIIECLGVQQRDSPCGPRWPVWPRPGHCGALHLAGGRGGHQYDLQHGQTARSSSHSLASSPSLVTPSPLPSPAPPPSAGDNGLRGLLLRHGQAIPQ